MDAQPGWLSGYSSSLSGSFATRLDRASAEETKVLTDMTDPVLAQSSSSAALNLIDDGSQPPIVYDTWEQLETAFVERKPYGRYCTLPLSVIGSLHSGRIEVECDGQVLRVRMDPIREGDF